MLGFSVSGIGGASAFIGSGPVLFESSGRTVGSGAMTGTASCARTNADWASATPMHTTVWRMALWRCIADVFCRLEMTSNKWSILPTAMFLSFLIVKPLLMAVRLQGEIGSVFKPNRRRILSYFFRPRSSQDQHLPLRGIHVRGVGAIGWTAKIVSQTQGLF
jgi:hypothetical protein